MRDFEYYLDKKDVRKASPDKQRAISLAKDMKERISDATKLDINTFPKIIFENVYDALREFCDALLSIEGYKSYSHEGSISFLAKKGFDIAFISAFDKFRYKRNGSKYYAEMINPEDAKSILDFYNSNKNKIEEALNNVDIDLVNQFKKGLEDLKAGRIKRVS
jgi:uncharacterized protein (UPF0332 family)